MSAPTAAIPPSAAVTEIPGRFSPLVVVDKRNIANITTSTATSAQLAYLPRAESASHDFNTPLQDVVELGANFRVGDYDDIPENKISISNYDVGPTAISLITGKMVASTGTTTFGFNELNEANVDIIRQFADPNGNIFYSEYMGDHVIEEYDASLKAKSASMETYSLVGFNTAGFRGQIQCKAYIAQSADATAHSFSISSILGANEAPYPIPIPSGSSPASYWVQTGRINFLKIERWRPSTGFIRLSEVATTGAVAAGKCNYTAGTLTFFPSDLATGDVFLLTYMTYKSNVTAMSTLSGLTGINYSAIPQLSTDTSDPVAVPTRLTPITIAAYNIPRGQSFDIKMTLKRDRAEGIGDPDGIWGPSDAPEVALSLEVKMTDASLNGILQNGNPNGSDAGGSTSNDFFDPNEATRNALATDVPITVTINDPRNSGTVLKTITSPNAVMYQRTVSTPTKGPATVKYTGKDVVGNIVVSVTH
jgi:hypothetical protein